MVVVEIEVVLNFLKYVATDGAEVHIRQETGYSTHHDQLGRILTQNKNRILPSCPQESAKNMRKVMYSTVHSKVTWSL